MRDEIAIACIDESHQSQAVSLARQLKLNIDNKANNQLQVTAQGLWLKLASFKPMQVDFSWKTWRKRTAQGKRQDIIKACKIKPGMTVIDATAGWGRDAALLASFGAKVILFERNPVMQALLLDGISRQSLEDKQHLSVELIPGEAKDLLKDVAQNIDLIYIDPMHPQRQKSALVKKDLQALQTMIGPDADARELIECALSIPCPRVVVKWPVHLPPLLPPTCSWSGKTVRYDLFNPFIENT
jgi:16S rRNA (guanine1516-N2)-methyltransferase